MPASLIDTNIWLARTFPTHPLHAESKHVIAEIGQDAQAMFCRSTQQSYLRLLTTSNIFRHYGLEAMTNRLAIEAYATLCKLPGVGFQPEPAGIEPQWHKLAKLDTPSPKVWMDAYLAAFAIQAGLQFVTNDRDFRRFVDYGLRLRLLG
ncbi:MAG: PIN domain-containing protein [Verrucomicrobiota bacterium JB022]|nr:PIN domain-containing protein [Verrucomicrobiota bacterium JB022]